MKNYTHNQKTGKFCSPNPQPLARKAVSARFDIGIYTHEAIADTRNRTVPDSMGLATVQIGIRAICKEEGDLIKEKHLTVFRAREIATQPNWIERAIASIPT